jgi:putative MFS transporter
MVGFVVGGDGLVHNRALPQVLLVVPIWSISILGSVLGAYAVEIYPTKIRSRAAAGCPPERRSSAGC